MFTTGTPLRQTPRDHNGNVVTAVTCTLRCHVTVGGYVTIGGKALQRVRLVSRRLSFAGTQVFGVSVPSTERRALTAALASGRRPLRAYLTISATAAAEKADATATQLQIKLLP
jgi:hypothetical protein